jgi:hypothetical protein
MACNWGPREVHRAAGSLGKPLACRDNSVMLIRAKVVSLNSQERGAQLYADNLCRGSRHRDFHGKGKKPDRLRWIVRLNKARQITHHAEKGPLSRDQIEFVRRVHAMVKEHIEQRNPVPQNFQYLVD